MAPATQAVNTSERLQALRKLMSKPDYNVAAVVVPSEDQRKHLLDVHTTSLIGCAIITPTDAFLFTDGRYFLQAEKQLDRNWTLMRQGLPDVPTWQEFLWKVYISPNARGAVLTLSKKLPKCTRIGVDPTIVTASDADTIQKNLEPLESQLVSLKHNLVDLVWTNRPPRPTNGIYPLDLKYAGESHVQKITRLREEMRKKEMHAVVVNMLDEVAWLFNLRGSDIDYNPVFFAYAVLTPEKAHLFLNPAQIDDTLREHLGGHVDIHPYDSFFSYLRELGAEIGLHKKSRALVGDKASLAIVEAMGADNVVVARSPVADFKAVKNETEVEGFRQSHIRDGVALVRYFAWLEEQLNNGVELNECQVADQLEHYRAELDFFRGLSFPTISATGPNGAIIHYQPEPNDCAIVRRDQAG
ncbi:hypothetical protein EVJ58_g5989 [Rhodofomes roseus]|uniref:Xaa-Pro aminopeptidase n=1 Tax=Rhodofomes roseus TaxID=34475 RepID=A0A4Y9YCB7_9APHY|nr:hypothetical protein EVJ58_g5989 [Rhodofomes roseus]